MCRACLVLMLLCLLTPGQVAAAVVYDCSGKVLTLDKIPQRVVSLVPSASEILFEIGAGDNLIGLTYHDATLAGAEKKAVVGGFFKPSMEKIRALEPDLVIVSTIHAEILKMLKSQGIPVFVYDIGSLAQSFEMIDSLGRLFGHRAQAQKIIGKNRQQIDALQKKLTKAVPGPKKRVIRLMGREEVMTPGSDSFQNEMIRLAGGIPPDFTKPGSVVPVEKEDWIRFNPQVIYGCKGDEKAAAAFFTRDGWRDVDGVKNHQVFYFPCALTCRAATHTGYFVQWLSSMIYTEEFSRPENTIYPEKLMGSMPVPVDLDHVKAARINTTTLCDVDNKTLVIDFKRPQRILSTLEGFRDNILSVGNHYSPPPTWGPGHYMGMERMNELILKANELEGKTSSLLMTGANMDNLSVQGAAFKDIRVVALVTAGVMSNAMRMSKDEGLFYEPGTINIIILSNMALSDRAMSRAVITATEAKTAALEDLDIRSAVSPRMYEATGTGTDNMLIVGGQGGPIDATGGHTKTGELIARAVYDGVKEAILKQNKVSENRHIFQRLKERKISLSGLISGITCDCLEQNNIPKGALVQAVEHLLLEDEYAGFMETALAVSDEYEKGLIRDLTLFEALCRQVAEKISGAPLGDMTDYLAGQDFPQVLKAALNAVIAGAAGRVPPDPGKTSVIPEKKPAPTGVDADAAIPKRVVSLSPIITETIYLVGAEDRLIANTTYCTVPEAAKFKEKIGSVIQMNVEKIIRLKPDLVIASPLSREKQLMMLEKLHIPVLKADNPRTFDQICQMTLDFGRKLGQAHTAEKITRETRAEANAILAMTDPLDKPSVFIQIGIKPLHSANKDMFINEYIRYGGGVNVAEHQGTGVYSREKVLADNPDVILIATMGSSTKAGEQERKKWMTYKNLKAVQNGRVHVLDPEMICSPTPVTFVGGLKKVAKLLHPELGGEALLASGDTTTGDSE